MKKTFDFKVEEEKYILKNKNPNDKRDAFEISKNEMQFDTNKFYQYVFADINDKMEIEIIDNSDISDKAAKRVYNTISEIASGVIERMNKKCFEDG